MCGPPAEALAGLKVWVRRVYVTCLEGHWLVILGLFGVDWFFTSVEGKAAYALGD